MALALGPYGYLVPLWQGPLGPQVPATVGFAWEKPWLEMAPWALGPQVLSDIWVCMQNPRQRLPLGLPW